MKPGTMLFILLQLPLHSQAADGVLINDLPTGVSESHVLAITKQAFMRREWTIAASDKHSVTGKLYHREYSSLMTVSVAGKALIFHDETTTAINRGAHGPSTPIDLVKRKANVPDAWLENLRSDIATMLASVPPVPAPTPSAAERMKSLDELRTTGLITEAEYAAKRAEILAGL